MAQKRITRDGRKTIANTIYISECADIGASNKAKLLNKIHKPKVNKYTKSKVIVEVVENAFVPPIIRQAIIALKK